MPLGDDAGAGGPSLLSIAAAKVPRVGSIVVDPEVVDPSSYAGEETWVGLGKTVEDLHAALSDEQVQERLAPLRARGYRVSAARLERVLTVFGERADGRTGRYIILTMKRAAALADCTVRTVQRALTILRELGLMREHGKGRTGPAVTPAERLAMRQTGDRQTGVPVVRRITRLPAWIRSRTFVSPSPSATRSVPRKTERKRNITNRRGVDNSISWDALRIARELDRPGPDGGRFLRGRVHLHALARALDRFGVSPAMNGDVIWEALGHSPALGARSPIGWLLSRLRPGVLTPVLTRCDQKGHEFQSSGWCAHCETRRDDESHDHWFASAQDGEPYGDEDATAGAGGQLSSPVDVDQAAGRTGVQPDDPAPGAGLDPDSSDVSASGADLTSTAGDVRSMTAHPVQLVGRSASELTAGRGRQLVEAFTG
ncbi:hypothetical protein NY551_19015 [Curtobacterium flaccumfaciens pv. oortii]|uniref:hypothetical protein n=1 Tax=Curtobacterium flaccumfaciens TaxID=2035 RepID=UPI00265A09BC|nr:hypothetical protein [Curtobacterium flaccumfaciens]MCS5524832.1 hypothetical protein [Curtobacterium flaccumfaciens pv. oortii]